MKGSEGWCETRHIDVDFDFDLQRYFPIAIYSLQVAMVMVIVVVLRFRRWLRRSASVVLAICSGSAVCAPSKRASPF